VIIGSGVDWLDCVMRKCFRALQLRYRTCIRLHDVSTAMWEEN
jgi:hypothetical protein